MPKWQCLQLHVFAWWASNTCIQQLLLVPRKICKLCFGPFHVCCWAVVWHGNHIAFYTLLPVTHQPSIAESRDQKPLFAWSVLRVNAFWIDRNSSNITPRYFYLFTHKIQILVFNLHLCAWWVFDHKCRMADLFGLTWTPYAVHQSNKSQAFFACPLYMLSAKNGQIICTEKTVEW